MSESNKRPVLEDDRHFLADALQIFFAVVGDVFVGHDHPAGIRLEKSHDVHQRDRLAHAAAAQNANCLSGHHAEADVVEHAIVAKGLGDILELDVGSEFFVGGHESVVGPQSSVFSRCAFAVR